MENSKTERLAYIDVARGFVIILMLIGHANAPDPLVKAIFGFHMHSSLYFPDFYIIKQNGPNSVSKNSQYPNLKLT